MELVVRSAQRQNALVSEDAQLDLCYVISPKEVAEALHNLWPGL